MELLHSGSSLKKENPEQDQADLPSTTIMATRCEKKYNSAGFLNLGTFLQIIF